jgi:hypothetical protein
MSLPRLFDDHGAFIEPDAATLAALPPAAVQQLGAIRRAYETVQEAEHGIEIAQEEITAALAQVAAAEKAVEPYGPYDHFRLWQQVTHGI